MLYTVSELRDKFAIIVGDTAKDMPDVFFIEALNNAVGQLPLVPKLSKIFSKHYKFNLDANGHYRWLLNNDFRRIIDIPMINFYTSDGSKPCKLGICPKDTVEFYEINGLVELKEKGTPCQYTIEQEDDGIYLVFDRPLDIPMIVDYIAYGFLRPVQSMDDTIEISAIAEPLILAAFKDAYWSELDDMSFASNISQYLDNKLVPEAANALHRRFGSDEYNILGEM